MVMFRYFGLSVASQPTHSYSHNTYPKHQTRASMTLSRWTRVSHNKRDPTNTPAAAAEAAASSNNNNHHRTGNTRGGGAAG